MISFQRVIPILILSMAALPACADSFTFSVSGSTPINLNSPNDNYWGDYETHVDGPGTTPEVEVGAPLVGGELNLANQSFFLPAGSTITSASLELILPTTTVAGTSVASIASEHLPPPNPGDPTQVAPTFVDPGTAYLFPFEFVNGHSSNTGTFDLTEMPVVAGNEISTGDLSLEFTGGSGYMEAIVATQGYNFSGYVDATGEVNLPYTLEVVGDYTSVTPEPAGVVLLGTGMLALMVGAGWRRAAGC